jgi:hypothetical protein
MKPLVRRLAGFAVAGSLLAAPATAFAQEPNTLTPNPGQGPSCTPGMPIVVQGSTTTIFCGENGQFPYPVYPYAYWPDFTDIRGEYEDRFEDVMRPILDQQPQPQPDPEIITEGPIDVPDDE